MRRLAWMNGSESSAGPICRAYVRKGEGLVLEGVERAQTARGPVLVERGVGKVASGAAEALQRIWRTL